MNISKSTARQATGSIGVILLVTMVSMPASIISADAGQEAVPVAEAVRAERRAAMLLGDGRNFAGGTKVFGTAYAADNSPIPYARLQLRNVTSGFVEATTTADETGAFTFGNIEGGTYVVEALDANSNVLGVGQVFSLAPGETMAIFLKLTPSVVGLGGALTQVGGLGGSAGQAIAAASSLGVPALVAVGRPASREQ